MSLEYKTSTKRSRKATRTQRRRPVLVTVKNDEPADDEPVSAIAATEELPTQSNEPEQPAPPAATGKRLPRFFPTVGKTEQEESDKVADATKARLARAIRGKAAPSSEAAKKTANGVATSAKETSSASNTRSAQKRPAASPFKTRYILGIAIYLLAAQVLNPIEALALRNIGAERAITQFTLFGNRPTVIYTSTIVFLASLIVILVVLARMDLIPRSLGASRDTSANTARSSSSRKSGEAVEKAAQPTIKQGVQGENDDLYHAYRTNQRREKKR